MATRTLTEFNPFCQCLGRQHVVCRRWTVPTGQDTLTALWNAMSPAACHQPARPRLFDCGCAGHAHPVCDPTFARLTTEKPAKKLPRLTLKKALAEGLTLRPHTTHTYRYNYSRWICDCGDVHYGQAA